jgi:hypothetical protein
MSVYAANRLNSIRENKAEEMLDEFAQAFLDESKETADVTPFGVIAQLHENDMRMFDAVITSDFSIVAESAILEADEAEANQEKVDSTTKKGIGAKIKEALAGLKNAIIAIYRKLRDKVLELVSADKKIVKIYEPIIKGLNSSFSIKAKGISADIIYDADLKSIVNVYKDMESPINVAINNFEKAKKGNASESNRFDVEAAIQNISNKVNDLTSKLNTLSDKEKESKSAELEITSNIAKDALDELKSGKDSLRSIKDGGSAAIKAIKNIENMSKSYEFLDAQQANDCYKLISGAGKQLTKVSKIHTHIVAKKLSTCRKIVLLAGRSAKNQSVGESALDQYVINALMESSDLYVAEKFAY